MEDAITIEFTPAPEDRAEAMLYASRSDWKAPIRFALTKGPALALAAAVATLFVAGYMGLAQAVVAGVLLAALPVVGPTTARSLATWRPFNRRPRPTPAVRLTFSETGVTIHGEAGDTRFSWASVRDVVASGRATIVDVRQRGRCVIPARAFATFEEYRTFAGIVQTWHFEARRSLPPEALLAQ